MPDGRLDELYREPPDRFVAARDRLAKELRAGGDDDEAARTKKLRRPTVAAWIVNRAALDSPDEMREVAAASRDFEEAQRRAVEGADDAGETLRAAAAREREAVAAVLESAERHAREAGHAPSSRTMELVEDTLRAASGDAELRDRVVAGRLEREQSGATLGVLATGAPAKAARAPRRKRDSAEARRELARVERALAEAVEHEEESKALVRRAEETVGEAKERLADAKRRTAELRRERDKVRRRQGA